MPNHAAKKIFFPGHGVLSTHSCQTRQCGKLKFLHNISKTPMPNKHRSRDTSLLWDAQQHSIRGTTRELETRKKQLCRFTTLKNFIFKARLRNSAKPNPVSFAVRKNSNLNRQYLLRTACLGKNNRQKSHFFPHILSWGSYFYHRIPPPLLLLLPPLIPLIPHSHTQHHTTDITHPDITHSISHN